MQEPGFAILDIHSIVNLIIKSKNYSVEKIHARFTCNILILTQSETLPILLRRVYLPVFALSEIVKKIVSGFD